MKKIEVNKCRACCSTNVHDLNIVKEYYLMNLDKIVSLNHKICLDCQFIFQGEYVGDDFLDYYYKNSPMNRREAPTKFELDQYRRQSDFIINNLSLQSQSLENKNILEIGSDTGGFLVYLHKHYGCNAFFDEKSEEAVEIALSKKVLTRFDFIQTNKKMDLVILRHVFEHVFGIEKFIEYVNSIIKDKGYLFIEVPDWSWLDCQTDPLIFEHLSHFNTDNLIHLMRRLGWKCDALEKSIEEDDPATPNRVQRLLFKKSDIPVLGDPSITKVVDKFYSDIYGKGNALINDLLHNKYKGAKIALYPASHLSYTALIETDLKDNNVVGFFDMDKKKHGKIFKSIKVYPAEKLKEVRPDIIIIFTMAYEREIRESFIDMQLNAEILSITEIIENAP